MGHVECDVSESTCRCNNGTKCSEYENWCTNDGCKCSKYTDAYMTGDDAVQGSCFLASDVCTVDGKCDGRWDMESFIMQIVSIVAIAY